MKERIKILLFFYCISYLTFGQPQNIEFEHLTTEDGLSNNSCYCTLRDKEGYMWFATEDGLDRWDGNEFTVFRNNPEDSTSISNSKIMWITEDVNGTLWISTIYGLNKFDRSTEKFKRYFFYDVKINEPHANTIGPIVEDGPDFFWIGTHLGLVHFNKENGSFKRFIPDSSNLNFSLTGHNTISWITRGQKNELLIRSVKGLLRFNIPTGKFKQIRLPDNYVSNPRLMPIAYPFNIKKDFENNLWLQLNDGKLYKYNIQTQRFIFLKELYMITGLTINDQIFTMGDDKTGYLWLGTLGKGLYCVDWGKRKFVNYLPDTKNLNSISSNWIYNIYVDREGILWASSFNKGVEKITIHKELITSFEHDPSNKNGLQDGDIMDLCEDNEGMLWVASLTKGVSKLNLQTGQFIHIPYLTSGTRGTKDRRISSLFKDRSGTIWIGSLGLDKYDPKQKSFTHFTNNPQDSTSISNGWIISIFEDSNGYLWCGLKGNGLDRFDQKHNIFKHYRYNQRDFHSLCNNDVNCINQDDNNAIWVGTENGLCKFIANKFFRFKHQKGNPKSISGNLIYSIFKDLKNRMWIGTDAGLNLLKNEDDTFMSFDEINILNRNKIFGILEDSHNTLWLRTNLGLIRLNPDTKKYHLFSEKDGFKYCRSIAYGFRAFQRGKTGKIYYGGPQSLAIFNPGSLETNRRPSDVVLTKLIVNYKPAKIGDNSLLKKAINLSKHINLNYDQNILSFQFAALEYFEPDKIQYAYRLEGVNEDWVYCGNHRYTTFTNLDPGRYIFKVKASYNSEDWCEHIKSLIITIRPPWWATWWFRAAAIIFFVSGLMFLYKLRVNHLKLEKIRQEEFSKKLIESQEGERKRIAGELHDSLGQNLMIIYNDIQQYSQRKEIVPNELKSLFPEVKETIEEVRKIARNLHPHQLEQLGLTKAIKSIIRKLSSSTKINFHSNIEFIDELLPSSLWIHIYRIVQEALTNIIKHSEATDVRIILKKEKQNIFMLIEDNGKGIKSIIEKTKNGFGLENLKERARLLGSKLEISSLQQKGVKVLMHIPVRDK